MQHSRRLLSAVLGFAAVTLATAAIAQDEGPIRIGDLNSYDRWSSFTSPYKNGLVLATEQINAGGGIKGRQVQLITRDDGGTPETAAAAAEEMIAGDKVHMIAGTYLSNTGLAVAKVAGDKQVVFLAADPMTDRLVWQEGNRYTFRLRASTHMQAAMLAREAADSEAETWAIVAPDFEFGRDAVAAFKSEMMKRNPKVTFIEEQWIGLKGLEEPTPIVQAVKQANPDGIFTALFGSDLVAFKREGDRLGLFKGRTNIGMLTGEPEYILPLGEDAPRGWIVTGYPWYDIADDAHQKFVAAYQKRWKQDPTMGALVGYTTMMSIRAGIDKAGTTQTELLLQAFRGLEVDTPVGKIIYRKVDHQSTMGSWVGITRWRDSGGYMTGWRYVPGQDVLPSPEEVEKIRPDDSVN